MVNIQCKTRGDSDPNGKPRVFFACHDQDYELFFSEVYCDLLQSHDCAIFYSEAPAAVMTEDECAEVLGRMNLLVIPVTARFLQQPNAARQQYLPFALEHHIPVLPLLQEENLAALFNSTCGDLQFLDKHAEDHTAIPFPQKLETFLDSVLIGDETARKIRDAFSAYLFLSYRKKDRAHANRLMRLIHQNDFCRDVAIWYDEFLTPGENYNDSIRDALQKSHLFVLAVTPNLVNEVNYVMTTEYPAAQKESKPVLPVEMVPTDKTLLHKNYDSLPDCVNGNDAAALCRALQSAALPAGMADSAEHQFLIGLAYLSGVDVEVDHEKAVELITSAAENGYALAAEKLSDMYQLGLGVERDYGRVMEWYEKLLPMLQQEYDRQPTTENLAMLLTCIHNCGRKYSELGDLQAAKEKYIQCMLTYSRFRDNLTYDAPILLVQKTMIACFGDIAEVFRQEGNLDTAQKHYENCLELAKQMFRMLQGRGEEAVHSHEELMNAHLQLGALLLQKHLHTQAKEHFQEACNLAEQLRQQDDSTELRKYHAVALGDLGDVYFAEENYRRARTCFRDSAELCLQVSEELKTANSRIHLADAYGRLGSVAQAEGDLEKAHALYEERFNLITEAVRETTLTKHLLSLGGATSQLCHVRISMGDLSAAWDYCLESIKIHELLAKQEGTVPHTEALAGIHETAGDLSFLTEKPAQAAEYYGSAIAMWKLLQKNASSDRYAQKLAANYRKLGYMLEKEDKPAEAEALYKQALELLLSLHWADACLRATELGECYRQLGGLLRGEQAAAYYQKAIDLHEKAHTDFVGLQNQQWRLATLYCSHATAVLQQIQATDCNFQTRMELSEAAVQHYKKSVEMLEELASGSRNRDIWEDLAITYRAQANVFFWKRGKYRRKAKTIYRELCRQYPNIEKYRKNLDSF